MARTKASTSQPIELPALDGEMLTANQNAVATMLGSYSDERDLLNQLLGQAQMAEAFSKFSKTVLISKLSFVKENKLYQQLRGKRCQDGLEYSGTWADFCNVLGWTPEHANEAIANLRQFGEEALESMSRMGIGYREMRQYRRLPDDQKAALIEVAQTGDKDAFVDLAEEIIAKHAKEKKELTQRLDDVNADYEAQSEVMAKKTDDLDKTRQELEKLRKRIQALPASEAVSELRLETTAVAFEAEAKIRGALREGISKLAELGSAEGDDQRVFAAGLIRQLEITLAEVRSEFHLPAELDGAPAWMGQD
ncbi:hypothetical protein [Pseudomonas japonica]|uniref:Uncharacterized protein n=1 Tax=Pseudomonas japonica TaxID=256466 RepID=A0A239KYJ3_9PSED|nr:hypothetical protein [Pseudomonas japonica]SNT23281.1 hypothetical protein SAMN05444352_13040 [Pseudomonas japonica]